MAPIFSKPPAPPSSLELALRKARPVWATLADLAAESFELFLRLPAGEAAERAGVLCDRLVVSTARLLESQGCLPLLLFARADKTHASNLPGAVPQVFVLTILVMLYNAFVFAYMPAAGIAMNSPTSLLFHAFIFLVLQSYLKAVGTDPGNIPQAAEWRTSGSSPPRGAPQAKWCNKSQAYKPERAHFCSASRRPVLRMDHYCPWLSNTVGLRNHKFFYLFLLYSTAACGMLGMSVMQLLVHISLPALTSFLLCGAEGLALLLTSLLIPFLGFHTWLIARNMTTIEFCEQEEFRGSEYDQGLYKNICAVMGDNPWLWWLPAFGPSGDGLAFPSKWSGGADVEQPDEDDHEGRSVDSIGAAVAKPGEDVSAKDDAPSTAAATSYADFAFLSDGEISMADIRPGGARSDGAISQKNDDANCFLVWHSPEEFVDDLQVGCGVVQESLLETVSGAVSRLACMCAPQSKEAKQSSHASRGRGIRAGAPGRARASGASALGPDVRAGTNLRQQLDWNLRQQQQQQPASGGSAAEAETSASDISLAGFAGFT